MSKQKYRQVRFGAYLSELDIQFLDREHLGIFHRWGDAVVFDGQTYLQQTVAIVESKINGYVYQIRPDCLIFTGVDIEL